MKWTSTQLHREMTTTGTACKVDRALTALFSVLVITMPFSVKFYFPSLDLEVITPAELLIAAFALLFALAVLVPSWRRELDFRALKHPIVWAAFALLIIGIVTAFASSMPLVSFKSVIVKGAYLWVFFIFPIIRRDSGNLLAWRALQWYAWVFQGVIFYTLIHQAGRGWDRTGSAFASFPFYSDHTIYGAALTFVLFVSWLDPQRHASSAGPLVRWSMRSLPALVLMALYLSFCRAAWVAVFAVVPLVALLFMRVGRTVLLVSGGVALLAAFIAAPFLVNAARSSTADSNVPHAGGLQSLRSLTNVSTDASNMERLNRWSCAWRMFKDHPWAGTGPGTFQFKYIPYQRPEETTFLSLTGPMDPSLISSAWNHGTTVYVRGNPQMFYLSLGTAHSEYLMALTESGILAVLAFVALFVLTFVRAVPATADQQSDQQRRIRFACVLGVLAYGVHGVFNNFLDDCRIAFLFWSSLAVLVRSDRDLRMQ